MYLVTAAPRVEARVVRKIIRSREFKVQTVEDISTVLESLLSERHTGPIRIDMGQGSIRSMWAEDSAELNA